MVKWKRALAAVVAVCFLFGAAGRMCAAGSGGFGAVFAGAFGDTALAGFIKSREKPVVLLDAGHGGIDGGAQSADGVCEKDINLSICMKIRDILEENGVKTHMTRESDCGLYSDGKSSVRSKKSEDLHARLDMSYKLAPDAFVSVHLNSYRENRSVFGAQTFYTTSAETAVSEMSRILAEKIQALLVTYIENGNTRVAMEKNDVLLMKEAKVPTVIVECGFLSNAAEAEALQTEEYQDKIARAVADGMLGYFGIGKENSGGKDSGDIQMVDSEM